MKEQQVGGVHYAKLAIDPITVAWRNRWDFLIGSTAKYVMRFDTKGGRQDLEKAKHFIAYRLDLMRACGIYGCARDGMTMEEVCRLNGYTDLRCRVLYWLHEWACTRHPHDYPTDERLVTHITALIDQLARDHYGAPHA